MLKKSEFFLKKSVDLPRNQPYTSPMKIALEIDNDRYEVESYSLFDALEQILKQADYMEDSDSLEILCQKARYILDKAGV